MMETRRQERVSSSRIKHLKDSQMMNMEMKMTLEMRMSKLKKKISSQKISKT
jgi:hypothetical protein